MDDATVIRFFTTLDRVQKKQRGREVAGAMLDARHARGEQLLREV